jgi:hypothetical protein
MFGFTHTIQGAGHVALLSFIGLVLLMESLIPTAEAQTATHFNLTAISAANGRSTIECWQIKKPFDVSADPGTAGTMSQQLGDLTNLTFTILPPKFDGGLHNAPFVQYSHLPWKHVAHQLTLTDTLPSPPV